MRLLKLSSPSKTIPRFLTALLCFRAGNDEYETFLCLVSDQFVETMPRRKDIRDNLEEATVAVHQYGKSLSIVHFETVQTIRTVRKKHSFWLVNTSLIITTAQLENFALNGSRTSHLFYCMFMQQIMHVIQSSLNTITSRNWEKICMYTWTEAGRSRGKSVKSLHLNVVFYKLETRLTAVNN